MCNRLLHCGTRSQVWSLARHVHVGSVWSPERGENGGESDWPVLLDGVPDDLASRMPPRSDGAELPPAEFQVHTLFCERGIDGLAWLGGQYSIGVWEEGSERLWLVRDPWGVRPLYVAHEGSRWLFATEYKALLAIPELPAEPDRRAIQHIQSARVAPEESSCLENITPVLPGGWMAIGSEGARPGRFNRLDPSVRARDPRDHVLSLRHHLLTAARRKVRGHERVGVALTADMDTALTAAVVRRVAPETELHTLVTGMGPDDSVLARGSYMARSIGSVHHTGYVTAEDVRELLPSMVWAMENPVGRLELLLSFATAMEAGKHVPLLLTGRGADSLFGGAPHSVLVRAANMAPPLRDRLARAFHAAQTGTAPRSRLGRLLLATAFGGELMPPARVMGVPTIRNDLGKTREPASHLRSATLASLVRGRHGYAAVDRLCHAAGVLADSLFLDLEVVRCALRTPESAMSRWMPGSSALRRVAQGFLPEDLVSARPVPPSLRVDEPLCRVIDELVDELLSPPTVRRRGLVHPNDVMRLRRHGRRPYSVHQVQRLWSLFLLETWGRVFLDNRGAAPVSLVTVGRAESGEPGR